MRFFPNFHFLDNLASLIPSGKGRASQYVFDCVSDKILAFFAQGRSDWERKEKRDLLLMSGMSLQRVNLS